MVDYDGLTPEYVCHRRIHSGVLEILRARSGTARESKVLEVGCGTGNYICALQELTGCTCLGIDPSE
jgi:ubiquinone/menaquinone biosynthesis C-methylase UbiE